MTKAHIAEPWQLICDMPPRVLLAKLCEARRTLSSCGVGLSQVPRCPWLAPPLDLRARESPTGIVQIVPVAVPLLHA